MLEQPDVAGHQRRRGEAHRLPEREVPRHDGEHRAERLVAGVRPDRLRPPSASTGSSASICSRVLGVEAAARRALADLGLGRRERLAHLGGHQLGDCVGLGVEQVGGGAHPAGPLGERRPPVGRGSAAAARAEPVLELAVGQRLEGLEHLAGGRVGRRDRHACSSGRRAVPPPTADPRLGGVADVSVRPARPADAERVARVQLSTWRTAYADLLPAEALDVPRGAGRRALAGRGRGAADAAAPAAGGDGARRAGRLRGQRARPTTRASTGGTAELPTLLVEPRWGRRGHGSRLRRGQRRALARRRRHDRRHLGLGARPGHPVVPHRRRLGARRRRPRPRHRPARAAPAAPPHRPAGGADELRRLPRGRRWTSTRGCEADNTKAYWTDHKATYDACVKAPMEALLAELEPEFGAGQAVPALPGRAVQQGQDAVQDARRGGRRRAPATAALYVQLSADGLMVAGGYWHTATDQARRLRAAVADDLHRAGSWSACSTGSPAGTVERRAAQAAAQAVRRRTTRGPTCCT